MVALAATRDYQRAQQSLRATTYRDVGKLWGLLDPQRLDKTFTVFAAAVLQLIRARRQSSATLARAYLQALRTGVAGEPPVVDTPPVPTDAVLTSLRVTSVITIKSAMTNRVALDVATRNALVRTMGAVDKYVGDAGRELIRASVEADPAAQGWVRQTLGTCAFCASEAAGDNMHSGDADFPRHDHCGCVPQPVYGVQPDEAAVQRFVDLADTLTPQQLDDQLAQVRALLADPATNPQLVANLREGLARLEALAAKRLAITTAVTESTAIPTSVFDALMPRGGGWTTSTRAAAVAELKTTAEGRALLKVLDSFQSGASVAIPRLRTDIETYLAGGTLKPGRAETVRLLLAAIGRSDAGDRALWRGMSIPGQLDDVAARYKVGDDLDLSLASFTTDKKLAREFTQQGAGQKVRAKVKTPVLVEWTGDGKRALPIERLARSLIFANEKEWVGAGRYVIRRTRRERRGGVDTLILTIAQVKPW